MLLWRRSSPEWGVRRPACSLGVLGVPGDHQGDYQEDDYQEDDDDHQGDYDHYQEDDHEKTPSVLCVLQKLDHY